MILRDVGLANPLTDPRSFATITNAVYLPTVIHGVSDAIAWRDTLDQHAAIVSSIFFKCVSNMISTLEPLKKNNRTTSPHIAPPSRLSPPWKNPRLKIIFKKSPSPQGRQYDNIQAPSWSIKAPLYHEVHP